MPQKKIGVDQIASGNGELDLGTRLDSIESTATANVSNLQGEIDAAEGEIARVNEAVMAMASAPISTPVFNDVETYTVLDTDIVAATPTTLTVPNGKSYKVGKGNLMVLRNGIPQVLANGDYTEASATTIQYAADVLLEGDVITFVIGNASKLNYNVAVTYYGVGADEGRIETVAYTGDLERTITYTYNASGKIATETIVEGGKTTTKTYTYDGTTGRITAVASVVA